MRRFSIVVFAVALALGACKKEDKGATDKKEPAAKATGSDTMKKEPEAAKPEAQTPTPPPPAPAGSDTAPTPEVKPPDTAATPDSPTTVNGDTITLGYSEPKVGDKISTEKSQQMDLQIAAQGKQFPMVGSEHEVKTEEVLAATEDTVTKAKITYTTVERSQKLAGQEKLGPSAIVGKTYTVEAGTPITVTTDAGPASDAEAKEVQAAEKRFGKPDSMGKMLAGKSFTKDQPVDLPASEIAQAMGDDPGTTVKKLTMTYHGMEGDLAVFEMAMSLDQAAGPMGTMTLELTGTAKVDPKSNDLVEMALDGKISMTGQATAQGTMKMSEKHSR